MEIETIPNQIFCKPFDVDYYQYSFNMERFHLIDRHEFKEFLRVRSSIPYHKINDVVSSLSTFLIDNTSQTLEILNINEEEIEKEFKNKLKSKNNYGIKEEEQSWLDKVNTKMGYFTSFFTK